MPGEQLPQETLERIASFIYDNSELGDFWCALGQPERGNAAQAERNEQDYTRRCLYELFHGHHWHDDAYPGHWTHQRDWEVWSGSSDET